MHMLDLEELAWAEADNYRREARRQRLLAMVRSRDQGSLKRMAAFWRDVSRFFAGARMRPGHRPHS